MAIKGALQLEIEQMYSIGSQSDISECHNQGASGVRQWLLNSRVALCLI